MPNSWGWMEPEIAFLIGGFPIYHAYKDDEVNADSAYRLMEWFQIDEDGTYQDFKEFDIRDLPEWTPKQRCDDTKHYEDILRVALLSGSLVELTGVEIEFPLEEKTWSVGVVRTAHRTKNIKVRARSEAEAGRLALEEACDAVFDNNEQDAEYSSGGAICVEAD